MLIAVTGGIAAGKSTVFKALLEQLPDYQGISVDEVVASIYRELEQPHADEAIKFMRMRLESLFGTTDKASIAAQAVADPTLLEQVENIFMKAVVDKLETAMYNSSNLLVEFPLLIEKGWHQNRFDFVINVEADVSARTERAMGRENMTVSKLASVMKKQLTADDRAEALKDVPHYTLINNSQEDLNQGVATMVMKLKLQSKRVGIVSGSFDPITNGHLYLVKKALEMMDHVVIVLATNPNKKGMFTPDERHELVGKALLEAGLDINRINGIILPPAEMVVSYAKAIGAKYIIRGLRNSTDFEYEHQIELVQCTIAPQVDTLYLMTPRELTEVSSSMVKSVVGLHGWRKIAAKYVPAAVLAALEGKA